VPVSSAAFSGQSNFGVLYKLRGHPGRVHEGPSVRALRALPHGPARVRGGAPGPLQTLPLVCCRTATCLYLPGA